MDRLPRLRGALYVQGEQRPFRVRLTLATSGQHVAS
ncbi:uncharacterized protein METZ01_LOCUS310339 [marine metagenome]|uniref:Uncharacterized protein n=1 Tax=marine metagenome TaxID=408172 RepID=A0A382NAY4_9ZZZZ